MDLETNNNLKYRKKFKDFKCCVLIPTYNNSGTLKSVIDDVLNYCKDIYVVNDGSTDNTANILNEYENQINVIHFKENKGKGYALRLGFRKAYKDGFKHTVTIDSDGQHNASDLPLFIDKLEQSPDSVIIGSRNLKGKEISKGSLFANSFSNFWFRVETGEKLPDTQSGYRLYPLEPVAKMKYITKRYDFEIEVIVKLSWKGYNIIPIPVSVYYPPKEERISHYNAFKDTFRISLLNTVLVNAAFFYYLPRKIVRKYRKRKIKDIIKEELFGGNAPTHKIALSIGFGVFMGIVPIWGYQLAVGFLLAHLFKLNKSIFFVFANISIPPMIPVILYLSYIFGGFILGEGSWKVEISDISFETVKENLMQYVIGSVALAISAGISFSGISYILLMIFRKDKK